MRPREIHDLLLSLLCRGMGFWLLYQYMPYVIDLAEQVMSEMSSDPSMHRSVFDIFCSFIEFGVKISVAAYFILGAPPFLKRAAP